MSSTHLPVAQRARTAVRRLACSRSSAAPPCSSGCYTTTAPVVTPAASDYRLRHPIAIKEGARTVELFIGSNRGGLTGDAARRRARLCADLAAARRPAAS